MGSHTNHMRTLAVLLFSYVLVILLSECVLEGTNWSLKQYTDTLTHNMDERVQLARKEQLQALNAEFQVSVFIFWGLFCFSG